MRSNSSGDLYPFFGNHGVSPPSALTVSGDLWHQRLGHPGAATLSKTLASFQFLCNKSTKSTCHARRLGKHVRLPFQESTSRASFPFELLHCDVWTSPIPSNSGFTYYLVIMDDYSHFVWTFPLRKKSDVAATLIAFYSYVSTQFGRSIQALQTDNGKEFDNLPIRTLLSTHGTIFHLTCPLGGAYLGI